MPSGVTTSHQAALAEWKEHTGAKLDYSTDSRILHALIEAYPGHHVTRTNPSKCDVLGYANAGSATATPQMDDGYDATRVYRLPHSRLDGTTGKLEDVVNFGRWSVQYKGNDFILYEVSHLDRYMQPQKLQYLLIPHEDPGSKTRHDARTDELLLAAGIWTRDLHEQVWVFDDSEWMKSSSLWQAVQGTTWNDVVLEPLMRSKLHRDVHGFFDNRYVYRKAAIPWKRGIIFHGVPGNGKSMTLAVTINELAKRSPPIPALYVKSLDACSGPKWSLQQIFTKARRTAPCMLVLEDLDSLVTDNTRSYFLNQVDGLESNDGILIIGSTNHLDRLDTSVTKRPSRFDRKYHFKVPEEAERLAYCRYWRSKFEDSDLLDLPDELCSVIAKWTAGYSFAYLKELFVTSLLLHTSGEDPADNVDGDSAGQETNGVTAKPNGEASGTDNNKASEADTKVSKTDGDQPTAGEADVQTKDQTAETTKPKTPPTLPYAEVPETLRENPLLDIFRTQARTLLEEIDHVGNSDGKLKALPPSDPPVRFRMRSLLDDEQDEQDETDAPYM